MTDIPPTEDQLAWARETQIALNTSFSYSDANIIACRLAEREKERDGAIEEVAKTIEETEYYDQTETSRGHMIGEATRFAIARAIRSLTRPATVGEGGDAEELKRIYETATVQDAVKRAVKIAKEAAEAVAPAPVAGVVVPDGWQLVPKEPTSEMINSAREPFIEWKTNDAGGSVQGLGIRMYRAYLAAAPAAQGDGGK